MKSHENYIQVATSCRTHDGCCVILGCLWGLPPDNAIAAIVRAQADYEREPIKQNAKRMLELERKHGIVSHSHMTDDVHPEHRLNMDYPGHHHERGESITWSPPCPACIAHPESPWDDRP